MTGEKAQPRAWKPLCRHCGRTVRRAEMVRGPWVHDATGREECEGTTATPAWPATLTGQVRADVHDGSR